MAASSDASRQGKWKALVLWTGIGVALSVIIQLMRRVFGTHLGGAVVIVPIAFGIVYTGMRRTHGASRPPAAAIALCIASVSAAWFYLIGI
jgi:hypothetical protein